ncbi:hypothetical protein [Okeania sp. SIO2B3]|uniref:hypothetical protein n=1 Tax=Okeania sp. SIO2B3 TaxID=2607784 RepID=UPI0013C25D92|nr:hypothetical protein [Okeania sp. SIO2B3]NET45000.1 hypothetical protein [Okeania sp. SIO2B3]
MMYNQNSNVPPGWLGGFAESKPAFAYPEPDLSSLPMLCNMDNIERIKRQQRIYWPEFSWETIKGDPSSRCFQRFAHNISSIGYDDSGRVWSIICPQQGICAHKIGCLNVEVTVTGQRGWVNETTKDLAADMTVEGKIWFSPSSQKNEIVQQAWELFEEASLPFPSDKANAIQVSTHKVGNPDQPIFTIRHGESQLFQAPDKFRHEEKAWTVGHIEVEIGEVVTHNHPIVDAFNQKIIDIFNFGSGNMLLAGNVLTWNLWFTAPKLVNTVMWRTHAERWRRSIEADHGRHQSSEKEYADGSEFKVLDLLEGKKKKMSKKKMMKKMEEMKEMKRMKEIKDIDEIIEIIESLL